MSQKSNNSTGGTPLASNKANRRVAKKKTVKKSGSKMYDTIPSNCRNLNLNLDDKIVDIKERSTTTKASGFRHGFVQAAMDLVSEDNLNPGSSFHQLQASRLEASRIASIVERR